MSFLEGLEASLTLVEMLFTHQNEEFSSQRIEPHDV